MFLKDTEKLDCDLPCIKRPLQEYMHKKQEKVSTASACQYLYKEYQEEEKKKTPRMIQKSLTECKIHFGQNQNTSKKQSLQHVHGSTQNTGDKLV